MEPIQNEAGELNRLFRLDRERDNPGRADELAALLEHQLAAVPADELGAWDADAVAREMSLSEQHDEAPPSFRELFRQAAPDVVWLDLTKRFAKASAANGCLPAEIAAVLYLAAIAAASVHAGERITELDFSALNNRITWALSQPWMDEQIGDLLRRVARK